MRNISYGNERKIRACLLHDACNAYGDGDYNAVERFTDAFRVSLREKPKKELDDVFKKIEAAAPKLPTGPFDTMETLLMPLNKIKACWDIVHKWSLIEDGRD